VRGTKKDAQRMAAELTVRPVNRTAGRSVADVLAAWIEHNIPTWAPASARDQASRAALVAADPIASLPLGRLGVGDVERWHARLRRAGVGEAALRNRHQALRAALTQAVRWGWIATNPAAAARLHQAKTAPREALSVDEVRRVLDAAAELGPDVHLALRLAALTGARRAELAALRWEDVIDGRLRVDSSIAVIRDGSRGAAGVPSGPARRATVVDAPTKTAGRRLVSLDSETVSLIHRLQHERGQPGEWMFSDGDEPPAPDRIGGWWRRARAAAGLDQHWRLHDLRHWSATQAIAQGHDVRTVASRLGHANPAMTLRTYAHALEAADRSLADTLARTLVNDERTAGPARP
jgi:integrase